MARQTTDQLYIELDYYYPEEFYVYTAEAQADLSCSSSIDCTISNVRGADLIAFSDAALTADVEVTRDGQATITATATIDQFVGDLYALRSASLSSEFAQTVDANRLREPQIALSSEFTFDGIVSINGAVVGSGTFTATASLDITPELYKDMGANLYADTVMDPDGVERIRDVDSTQQVEFTQAIIYTKIVQGECAFSALFAPSMTVEAVRNAFAVLDSTSALAVVAIANRSADIALSSIVNQSLQGDRLRGYVINANSQFALAVAYTNTVPAQATLTSSASTTINVVRNRYAQASISGAFSPTITINLTKQGQISLSSAFTQSATVRRIRSTSVGISSAFSLTNNITVLSGSQFFVDALEISTNIDSTQSIADGAYESTTDSFGNVYTIGTKEVVSGGNYFNQVILTKNDARGKLQWQRNIGSFTTNQNNSNYVSVNLVISGSYLYISYGSRYLSYIGGGNNFNVFQSHQTLRLNLNSDVLQYLPNSNSVVHDMKEYGGNVYALSTRYSGSNLSEVALPIITKYNANGTIAWTKSIKFTSLTEQTTWPFSTFDVNASGVFCAVRQAPSGATAGGIFKFDLNGNYEYHWYGTTRYDNVRVDSSGNIYAAGRYGVSPGTTPRHILIKYNNTFTVQWVITNITTFDGYYDFDLDSNQDLVGVTDTGQLITVTKNGVVTKSKSLQIFNSSNTLYTTIQPKGINVKNGWANTGATWDRNGQRQYVSFQVQEDLSQSNFTVPVITPFADANNATLRWVDNTLPSVGTRTIDGSVNYTAVIDEATTSGSVSTASYTTTTYTDIPLLVAKLFSADINSQFALTANNRRLRNNPAQLTAQASVTATARKTARTPAQLTAEATIVPNGGYIKGGTANLTSTATVTASLGLIKRHSATLNAQAVVTVSTRKYVGNGASLFAVLSVTANNGRIRSFTSAITALGSELAAVNKIGRGLIQCDIVAQQTTAPVKTVQAHIDASTVLTQTAEAAKTVRTGSSVTAQATFSVQALKIPATPVSMESAFTQTTETDNSKTTRITANVTTSSQLSVNAVKTARTQPQLTSEFSQTFGNNVTRLRLADSQQSAVATVLAPAVKTVRISSNMQAFDTVLAIGTKISFDPDLQLTIPAEYSTVHVLEENTLLTVNPETRVNMVRMTT